MKNRTLIAFGFAVLALFLLSSNAQLKSMHESNAASPRFEISFPETASRDALDGRLLMLISKNN